MSCNSCSGGCGGGCSGCGGKSELDKREREILLTLAQTPFLPIVQYARRESYFSPKEPLEPYPVYLTDADEDTCEIELTSLALRKLASRGYITLDYDIPLSGYDYFIYNTSALKQRLSILNSGFTVLPIKGSMALTLSGQEALDNPDL